MSATPALSTTNVTAAPTSTMLGLGLAATVLQGVATTGVPTTTAGWLMLAMQAVAGAAGIFGRA